MAATPTPPSTPTSPKGMTADVWAFCAFVIVFLLTLLIGLANFLFSYLKYRS